MKAKKRVYTVVVQRTEVYNLEVKIEADSPEQAVAIAREREAENEYAQKFDCPDTVEVSVFHAGEKRETAPAPAPKVIPPPAGHDSWYDWQGLTDADHHKVSADSMRRGWGYSLADLRKEIANFKKAMAKGDIHATSMICARLEDCNYHDVCGKLAEGDIAGATKAAEAIYAE